MPAPRPADLALTLLRWANLSAAAILSACVILSAGCASAEAAPPVSDEALTSTDAPGGPAAAAAEEADAPYEPRIHATLPGTRVSHLGRTVLRKADLIVRARVEGTDTGRGIEIVHLADVEALWGDLPAFATGGPLRAVVGEPGVVPQTGREAVFFLSSRPRSYGHELVQVMRLDDAEADERFASLKTYLEIEGMSSGARQVAELKAYLRAAVRDPRRWTRANAALEFGSLARERPGDVDWSDVDALEAGRDLARDEDARNAIDRALAVARRNAPPDGVDVAATLPRPVEEPVDVDTGGVTEDDITAHVARFRDAEDPEARRDALLLAAAQLEQASLSIVRRGLTDDAPGVRDAALAAAAQLDLLSVGDAVVVLLETESDPSVLLSAVRAAGFLRTARAVPALTRLLDGNGALANEAAVGLARIRDDDALAALLLAHVDASGPRREALAKLLDDGFEAAEKSAGRGVGPR